MAIMNESVCILEFKLKGERCSPEIGSVKTISMENVSTGVLDKNKQHYLRCKDKAKSHMMY